MSFAHLYKLTKKVVKKSLFVRLYYFLKFKELTLMCTFDNVLLDKLIMSVTIICFYGHSFVWLKN